MGVSQTAIINVCCGLFVSLLFIFILLFFFKPKIEISKYICHRDGAYWFKMVNRSIYHAFDVKLELSIMTPLNGSEGHSNLNIFSVPLKSSSVTSINRVRNKEHCKDDPFGLNAYVFFTDVDIEKPLMSNSTYLELRITARHGLSGLADRFVQRFSNESVIKKDHKFKFGKVLETIPANTVF